MKRLISLILLALSPVISLGQTTNIAPRVAFNSTPGEMDCPTYQGGETLYCYYTLQNLPKAQTLVKKIEQTILKGDPILPGVGILDAFGDNDKVLVFSHKSPEVLKKMKSVIPLLDTNEAFATRTMVEVKTEIIEINESGLSSLGAEISNLKIGFDLTDLLNGGGATSNQNGLGIDLKLGIVQLSALISAERSKGNVISRGSVVKAVPNLSDISYSDRTAVYAAPGVGSSFVSQNEGVNISGVVSVNANDPSLVNIKNFSLEYGTMVEDERVNIVSIPYDNLILREGVAFPLVSAANFASMTTTKAGLFGLGKTSITERSKLMVYATVEVVDWDEYINEIRDLMVVGRQYFDEEEIEAMPEACPLLSDVFHDLELSATRDSIGDPMLSVGLKKEYACPSMLKKKVRLRIRGEGIDKDSNEHYTTVERLMLVPYRIEDISPSRFQRPRLKFKIKLEAVDESDSSVKLKAIFAPDTLQINDMFWIDP